MTTTIAVQDTNARYHVDEYNELCVHMQRRFDRLTADKTPVFQTDATDVLWTAYVNSFPESDQQYHNCSHCRHFMKRFGGLVVINEDGSLKSVMWPSRDDTADMKYYGAAVENVRKLVIKAKVKGPFLNSQHSLGTRETTEWTHFAIVPTHLFRDAKLTAGQKMAEKRQDFINMKRALEDFPLDALVQMMRIINTEALYNNDAVVGPGKWLHDLQVRLSGVKHSRARDNLLWRAIGSAPDAFCHVRGSMVGTLLEDIKAGLSFDDISNKFKAKMHPLRYQRPQAPPSEGNVVQAEKLVAKLGITNSLARRWANIADIQEKLWEPTVVKPAASDGVFGHLKPKARTLQPEINTPVKTMTWDKFQRTVLPEAEKIEYCPSAQSRSFAGLLTALDENDPPIILWDHPEKRNPVSWYFHQQARPIEWNLPVNAWVNVLVITPAPYSWHGGSYPQFGQRVFFVLENMQDMRSEAGTALFPQILKSELREVRATIEAHSKVSRTHKTEAPQACAVVFSSGNDDGEPMSLKVTTKGNVQQKYLLDRWD